MAPFEMTPFRHFRKGLLIAALCGLVIVGAGLFEVFLPYEWHHAISQRIDRILPREVYAPHPDMDWEFELDFREYPTHRLIEFGILGVLLIGDAYLILRVWRAIRECRSES